MSGNLILVGVISSAYQLQGLVKISSYTSPIKNICNYPCLDKDRRIYKLKFIREDKKKVIARIDGVTDRTMAEKILKTKLYVERGTLPNTDETEHYISDLVGMDVLDDKNNLFGKVKAFHNFGAGDIIEISFEDRKSEMYPFTKELFPEVSDKFVKMNKPSS